MLRSVQPLASPWQIPPLQCPKLSENFRCSKHWFQRIRTQSFAIFFGAASTLAGLKLTCVVRVGLRRGARVGCRAAPEAVAWERLSGVEELVRVMCFPEEEGARCVAVVKGKVAKKESVCVRVHSECLLGDALGSTRCQCGVQLRSFIETVLGNPSHPYAILLYLQGQEGKGIGLSNKLRAYVLQDSGLNEEDANLQLGFPPDLRKYQAVRTALEFLEVKSVVLYTGSPRKISFLSDKISGVVPWSPRDQHWEVAGE
eukprot:Skav228841  [mRNA]  locus=scaffold4680:158022:158792:+ [translate_table: standard]